MWAFICPHATWGDLAHFLLSNISKEIPYGKSEEILKGILQHEFSHAEDIANGISFGNGLKVDGSNIQEVHPIIFSFISDIKAQFRAIDYVQANFGRDNKAYSFMLHQLSNEVMDFNIFISHTRGQLIPTGTDTKLYDFYFPRLEKALEEARKILR